ncbi:hypothetical protein EJB05_04505, partial [Eragrostis curvula]
MALILDWIRILTAKLQRPAAAPPSEEEKKGAGRVSNNKERTTTSKKQSSSLYLVFDDWSKGYTIRNLSLSSGDNPSSHLPAPISRFEAQRGLPAHVAATFDSKIIATQPVLVPALSDDDGAAASSSVPSKNIVPVFDVRTRSLRYCPRPSPGHGADPVYFPVDGGRLFALAAGGCFEVLRPPAADRTDRLPAPPFESRNVTSYALHPDGQTIFVSVKKDACVATFTFDTTDHALEDAGGNAWKPHGAWSLPFAGRGLYHPELDAWVGLSRDDRGRLCSCDVMPPTTISECDDASDDRQRLDRKLCRERMFNPESYEKHFGATLVYMGGARSNFCLVESITIRDDDSDDEMDDDCKMEEEEEQDGSRSTSCRWIRLTTFCLKYDGSGNLTYGNSRHVRCYKAPDAATEPMLTSPVAFWM